MPSPSRTLVICDGGVTSLTACVAAIEAAALADTPPDQPAPPPILWTPAYTGPTAPARERAIEAQAAALALPLVRGIVELDSTDTRLCGEDASRAVLTAAYEAQRLGCDGVMWPVQFEGGLDTALDLASRAADRALLISRVVGLDTPAGRTPIVVDAPYADLADREVAELVLDLQVPLSLCWWWNAGAAPSPETALAAAKEKQRWLAALEPLGWRPSTAETDLTVR